MLYRGKDEDTGVWYTGDHYVVPAPPQCFANEQEQDTHYIVFKDPHYLPDWNMPYRMVRSNVIPESVGLETGETDMCGCIAFQGDIIKYDGVIGIIRFGKYQNPCECATHIGFYVDWHDKNKRMDWRNDLCYWLKKTEIIGNVVDNSDLLTDV